MRKPGNFLRGERGDWDDRLEMRGKIANFTFDESQIDDISELFLSEFTQRDIVAYCRIYDSECNAYCINNPEIENCQFYQNMKERRLQNEENN